MGLFQRDELRDRAAGHYRRALQIHRMLRLDEEAEGVAREPAGEGFQE